MPSVEAAMEAPEKLPPCQRCKSPSVLISRKEAFCKPCFIKFVQYKQRKRMEAFKVNYNPGATVPRLLIPLSLGKSSLSLLDMVCDLLRVQSDMHRSKQGFKLLAVHLDETAIHRFDADVPALISSLREKYPECRIESIKIESFIDAAADLEQLELLQGPLGCSNTTELMTMLVRRTPQQDLMTIIRTQLINKIAEKFQCDSILWGHNMTRLAELVVSLTAKGRGDSISSVLFSEQTTPSIIYPLGEVLSTEISSYVSVKELTHLVSNTLNVPPATTKLQSIDELIRQYFVSVEEGFPSVVSTTVRTGAKLAPSRHLSEDTSKLCRLCFSPVQPDNRQWLDSITVSQAAPELESQTQMSVSNNASGLAQLCYGCLVTFRESRVGSIQWPARATKSEILDEFVLSDSD